MLSATTAASRTTYVLVCLAVGACAPATRGAFTAHALGPDAEPLIVQPPAPGVAVVRPHEPLVRAFTAAHAGEGLLDLEARVPGGDWAIAGREAVTLRVYLDDSYDQDVILHQGDRPHTYRLALGPLAPGDHRLRFEWLAEYSAAALPRVDVAETRVSVVAPSSPDYAVFANAPILYTRPDAHLNDTPFLMMAQVDTIADGGTEIRYTPIMSNEDGGTRTVALMARWGRAVDIDWAYTVRRNGSGERVRATYQGRFHATRRFRGRYEADHPLVQVSSLNNIYSDRRHGPLRLRLAPHFRLGPDDAREEILERHPWSYRLMAAELFREGKAAMEMVGRVRGPGGAVLTGREVIGDPRRFLVIEFRQRNPGRGVGVGVAVTLEGDDATYTSHRGRHELGVSREGWCRVAIELPRAITPDDLREIAFVPTGSGTGSAMVTHVRKAIFLDERFQPVALPLAWQGRGVLGGRGQRVVVYARGRDGSAGTDTLRD